MARLDGKVAIITGATGGIGEATAQLFLSEGAKVMLVGRSAEKLSALLERVGHEDSVAHHVADATDEAATRDAVAATVEAFGGVDILFANAGIEGAMKPLHHLTVEEFDQVLQTNVVGVWLSVKHCVGPLRERGGGSIVATTSRVGLVGLSGASAYVASKHAVCGFVKTAALELAESGIRVNAIAPGPIDNRMMRSLEEQRSPDDPDAMHEVIAGLIPMKRYGSNVEVAALALLLGRDESSLSTGAILTLDGGSNAA
jgi:NAD(P)-dependent dehydrogenase (short-subunit alcohol dehydrogenase family)